MIWSEPTPTERELFTRDPRRIVLETRTSHQPTRRATPQAREE